MSETIGVAVIGCGSFGSRHAEVYSAMHGVELVGVCDLNRSRAQELAQRLGTTVVEDVSRVAEDDRVTAVSVCTPDSLHCEPVVTLLRAGKHVMVEKPLATTLADCDRMIAAAGDSDTVFTVGHILRFDPRYHAAWEAIQRGDAGRLLHCFARRNNATSSRARMAAHTNVLFFLGIHDIDFINWCVGAEPVSAYCQAPPPTEADSPDSYLGLARYANGVVAAIEASWALPEGTHRGLDAGFEAVGTEGAVYVDGRAEQTTILRDGAAQSTDTVYRACVGGRTVGALRSELEHFTHCVRTGEEPLVSAQQARRAVAVTAALEESLHRRQPIHIDTSTP